MRTFTDCLKSDRLEVLCKYLEDLRKNNIQHQVLTCLSYDKGTLTTATTRVKIC